METLKCAIMDKTSFLPAMHQFRFKKFAEKKALFARPCLAISLENVPNKNRYQPSEMRIRHTSPVTEAAGTNGRLAATQCEAPLLVSNGIQTEASISQMWTAARLGSTTKENVNSEMERLWKADELAVMKNGRWLGSTKVFRQTMVIRSNEVGPDGNICLQNLNGLFQEVTLNQMSIMGIMGKGLGASRAMNANRLICVITQMHMEVDRYPKWEEVVNVDTWMTARGKNGIKRTWLVTEYSTGKVLARATSVWVLMNQDTRKISKIPTAVRMEMEPVYVESDRAVFEKAQCQFQSIEPNACNSQIDYTTADCVHSDILPKRKDLDMNSHVNNLKYVDWMLESVPEVTFETHELHSVTLEYRRECHKNDVLQALTKIDDAASQTDTPISTSHCQGLPLQIPEGSCSLGQIGEGMHEMKKECQGDQRHIVHFAHLIRSQCDGQEIVRARSMWRPLPVKSVC